MKLDKPRIEKIVYNIGLVVLQAQKLESQLKVVVSAMAQLDKKSALERLLQVKRKSLGDVVGRFLENVMVTDGRLEDLERYFQSLLDRRNSVVHHFFQVYGDDMEAGEHERVLWSLARLHEDLREASEAFEKVNQAYLSRLRELDLPEN